MLNVPMLPKIKSAALRYAMETKKVTYVLLWSSDDPEDQVYSFSLNNDPNTIAIIMPVLSEESL